MVPGYWFAGMWIDKIFDVKRVKDDKTAYWQTSHNNCINIRTAQGLFKNLRDKFYEDLISLVSKVGKKELVAFVSDLNAHVGKDVNGYDGDHEGLWCGF